MYGYPPPWGYPPQPNTPPLTQKDIERGIRHAIQLTERKGVVKRIKKEKKAKAKAAARARRLSFLEWFILGIVMQPIIGPLYHLAINHVTALAH